MNTDRIEKSVLLRAPRAHVWRALSDVYEFGRWFGVKLTGSFVPGARLRGQVTHPGYEHIPFEITIERVVPERHLSWRWHPNPIDVCNHIADEQQRDQARVGFAPSAIEGFRIRRDFRW